MSSHSVSRPLTSAAYPWYDSVWLTAYQEARAVLRAVAPAKLREFAAAMAVFRTPPGFRMPSFTDVFDAVTMDEIRHIVATLDSAQLEMHEAREFRRFVVHDHPRFTQLHGTLVERMSLAAGEPLEVSYNFLSLYAHGGVCPLHMDAPLAKFTLDLCVGQNAPWPIHFSPVVPWPEPGTYGPGWEQRVRSEVPFESFSLVPDQAVLFGGSSQWHYRDPMPAAPGRRYCDLLFFHFRPAGTGELILPQNWARLFDVPELARPEVALAM